ncbi:hydantoinase B/oxoprolinase family protein [Spartinivicinus poritis]|uniref:Hydantoinase B/oxoprolinase family protein n=1 Tax=Spartinivicinus poritis TaxID=2994640 RepID=A0ABT5U7Q3_9GAMM|nr:hydantoinase B/oxoprolinase family protein [Spartinivicinus sp. A2-2]MDE1462411.1 hydantoinase B/oxoprolinase family protein [Spartinivicinus sp. A2-2]
MLKCRGLELSYGRADQATFATEKGKLMNAVELGVFANRLSAVCDEMGAVLKRSAFSPNIKDRLDFSCAVFSKAGELAAQAAHIPVHLGSMAYAMQQIVESVQWLPGDMVVVNDPFLGGTHLPDVTIITPVFINNQLAAFVANRAHHANIGAATPGSMPVSSRLEEEGEVIPPTKIYQQGNLVKPVFSRLAKSDQVEQAGDFYAQISACQLGSERLMALLSHYGLDTFDSLLQSLNDYGERLARQTIQQIPDGTYCFDDVMDDDGQGNSDIVINMSLHIRGDSVQVDFTGTAQQVAGNINCPLSVTAAAVYYGFRCLMPDVTPACAGSFKPIQLQAPLGSLVNAQRPAAVAAGNVETSSRIVDVVLGALAKAIPERIPAASQGTMNNIAMGWPAEGSRPGWDYYETIAGGMGASQAGPGLTAVHSHMTNTLNTPVESLEMHYPLRIKRYAIRYGSGGQGKNPGGDGVVREFEFLQPTQVTLLTERRVNEPWGVAAGGNGMAGLNGLNYRDIGGKCSFIAKPGDVLTINTPGGGGYGNGVRIPQVLRT